MGDKNQLLTFKMSNIGQNTHLEKKKESFENEVETYEWSDK